MPGECRQLLQTRQFDNPPIKVIPTKPFITSIPRECHLDIAPYHLANPMHTKERRVGKRLACMLKEVCNMRPTSRDLVHIQRLMSTANMPRYCYRRPRLIILFLSKAHIERLKLILKSLLGQCADQGGINPATQKSPKRNITFQLLLHSNGQ